MDINVSMTYLLHKELGGKKEKRKQTLERKISKLNNLYF